MHMKGEWTGSGKDIRTENVQRVMSLPATAPVAMVFVMECVFLDQMAENGAELSFAAKTANEVQNWALKSMCLVKDIPLQGLLEVMERSDRGISEGVEGLICDSPFYTRQTAELSDLKQCGLSLHDKGELVLSLLAIMELNTYGHLFSSAV